ncbi:hypothetical protein SDC9_181826 [bioreactor metagenome]|uniref:Uncharacterized protein n=1 Tax=bioreactor metagenome TaxID=1076179 RepID=A0A645HF65_9ZZZZ
MNERAERTLGNTVPQLLYLKKTGRFSVKKGIPSLSGPDEYIINVKHKTIRLWGTSSPVTDQNGLEEDRVFIFSDYEIIPKICPATDQKKASL